ncbi:U-box domain-containing protein 33-like isoform X2 [Corylus avellana]|uniref:U-box domain-containing protein 33-like isoform X2 n=1 Tax=Corylus avellana TaxID=13451 RepID=UPI00286CDB36|nr:U-box domain-containing protein 33-like isoform X2 [Corylus avellana]
MGSRHETLEDPMAIMASVIDDMIYVAMGKDVKECKSILLWALQNSGGRRICILHVHQPPQFIPFMGTKAPASKLKEKIVSDYRETERQNMHQILDEYVRFCLQMGVRAQKLEIEMDRIEKGIVDLISTHEIKKLVMGAAADKHYNRRMTELKSSKAKYVREQAPISCHIQFICKGHLIFTREASADVTESGQSNLKKSWSVALGNDRNRDSSEIRQSNFVRAQSVTTEHKYRDGRMMRIFDIPSQAAAGTSQQETSSSPKIPSGSDGWGNGLGLGRSPSGSGYYCSTSSPKRVADVTLSPWDEASEFSAPSPAGSGYSRTSYVDVGSPLLPQSPTLVYSDESSDDTLYEQLQQVMAENEKETLLRRQRAEIYVIEAKRRGQEESRQRKEAEEALVKVKEELENVKNQRDQVTEELGIYQEHVLSSKIHIAELLKVMNEAKRRGQEESRQRKEAEEALVKVKEELENVKNQRDQVLENVKNQRDQVKEEVLGISQEHELSLKTQIAELHKKMNEVQMERDNALKEAEGLRRNQVGDDDHFSEFKLSEIEEATQKFDESKKIGQGGYGSIYKGLLRPKEVAIKMLQSPGAHGTSQFQMEVRVLSQLRHPNLVKLTGSCPEVFALIYEYLPNGSLEDRLSMKDNSPPLSWQTRIRIATELCSVLVYLHSAKPHSIVHGDLKPSNILLDANFVSKLSDFGICRMLFPDESLSNNINTTLSRITDPKGTPAYIDPEFRETSVLTLKSDVYSFGIILLQLLTGRQPFKISNEVKYALDAGNLKALLDPLAGDWPILAAQELAHLGLKCCDRDRRSRPELGSEVLKMLEPMRASYGS